MNPFDWRNQPRTTTSPEASNRHVVKSPKPITFNGAPLSARQANSADYLRIISARAKT